MKHMTKYQIKVDEHQCNNFRLNDIDVGNKFDNFVLSVWSEIKGICNGYDINDSSVHIFIEDKIMNIYKDETIVTFLKSRSVIGKKIAILRTDIAHKDYLCRVLEE